MSIFSTAVRTVQSRYLLARSQKCLHNFVVHFTFKPCSTKVWHYSALSCTSLPCPAQYCTFLHWPAMSCRSLTPVVWFSSKIYSMLSYSKCERYLGGLACTPLSEAEFLDVIGTKAFSFLQFKVTSTNGFFIPPPLNEIVRS